MPGEKIRIDPINFTSLSASLLYIKSLPCSPSIPFPAPPSNPFPVSPRGEKPLKNVMSGPLRCSPPSIIPLQRSHLSKSPIHPHFQAARAAPPLPALGALCFPSDFPRQWVSGSSLTPREGGFVDTAPVLCWGMAPRKILLLGHPFLPRKMGSPHPRLLPALLREFSQCFPLNWTLLKSQGYPGG